jgi:Cu/Ag efflux pump CusA
MMTSIAFILGLLPLAIATGAAELSRRGVGTPVFGGMLAAHLSRADALRDFSAVARAREKGLRSR